MYTCVRVETAAAVFTDELSFSHNTARFLVVLYGERGGTNVSGRRSRETSCAFMPISIKSNAALNGKDVLNVTKYIYSSTQCREKYPKVILVKVHISC